MNHTAPISLNEWLMLRARAELAEPARLERGPTPLPQHPGLWLDRCLVARQEGNGDTRGQQIGRLALQKTAITSLQLQPDAPSIAFYRAHFDRHRAESGRNSPGVRRIALEFEATSRILLHPSTGTSVTDGSLLLHHTWGVPYLPGSALKGICRARASRFLQDAEVRALFGYVPRPARAGAKQATSSSTRLEDKSHSGLIDFWDALWIPEAPAKGRSFSPLALDVVTPHHSAYYTQPGKDGRAAPRETDSPVPAQLLTYAPGTRFLIVLEHAAIVGIEPWVQRVKDLLADALLEDGIGTRTAAGYGRLRALQPSLRPGPASGGGVQTGLAMVHRQRNDGAMLALLPDGGRVEARGELARELYQKLPQDIRERLDKGKTVRLQIGWVKEGNLRRLVSILEG